MHDAPGIEAVDVFADITATPEIEEVQLTDDLVYGNFEPRQTVPATEYAVGVRLASDNTSNAFEFDADLMAGMGYTAIAQLVDGLPAAQLLIDDYRSVATESKVRIVHGSPAAGPVDVYVFATDMDNPATPASGDPLLENSVYRDETSFVSLAPGSYDVLITLAGTDTVAIEVRALAVEAGGVYTAIARDPLPDSVDFGVILIAD